MNRISGWDFWNPSDPSLLIPMSAIPLSPLTQGELSCSGRRRPSNSSDRSTSDGWPARHSNQNFTAPFPSLREFQVHTSDVGRSNGTTFFHQRYVSSTISNKNCGGQRPQDGLAVRSARPSSLPARTSPLGFFSKAEARNTDFCCLRARPQPKSSAAHAGRTHAATGSFLQFFSVMVEA